MKNKQANASQKIATLERALLKAHQTTHQVEEENKVFLKAIQTRDEEIQELHDLVAELDARLKATQEQTRQAAQP